MFHLNARITILISLIIFVVSTVLAQGGNQGAISGTVTDPSGAVVPGAEIKATSTATGATFKTSTNGEGFFEFAQLPVGIYDINASKAGFSVLDAKGVTLTIGAKLTLNLALKISAQGQTIEIIEEPPVVETDRTQVSSTIDNRAIANLPTNGRNFIDFVLLTGGVNRDVRQGDLSFAGQRGTLNSLAVDGTDNNNTFFGQTLGRTGSGARLTSSPRMPYRNSR